MLIVVALAAYRIWRLVGVDTVFRRPREWVTGKWGQDSWATELVTCPWCAGSWITFAVTAVAAQVVTVRIPVLFALAAATVVGLVARVDEF